MRGIAMPDTPEERWEDLASILPRQTTPFVGPRADAYPTPDETIYEAVFRYQLDQQMADPWRSSRHYLALQGHDPSPAIMDQVRALVPWAQPLSQCRLSARQGVTDRETGAEGLIVEVGSLHWLHETAVDVVGGCYATPWRATARRYRVEYDGERWAVTSASDLWRV
jgi:hypothetical protein